MIRPKSGGSRGGDGGGGQTGQIPPILSNVDNISDPVIRAFEAGCAPGRCERW